MKKIQADTNNGLFFVEDFDSDALVVSEIDLVSMLDNPFEGIVAAEVSDETFYALHDEYTVHEFDEEKVDIDILEVSRFHDSDYPELQARCRVDSSEAMIYLQLPDTADSEHSLISFNGEFVKFKLPESIISKIASEVDSSYSDLDLEAMKYDIYDYDVKHFLFDDSEYLILVDKKDGKKVVLEVSEYASYYNRELYKEACNSEEILKSFEEENNGGDK